MPYQWLPCWRLSTRRGRLGGRTLPQKRQQPGCVDARPPPLALADARSPLADVLPLLLQARFLCLTRFAPALFLFLFAPSTQFLLLRPLLIRSFRGGSS